MSESPRPLDNILRALQERAKELSCLYQVDEILHGNSEHFEDMLRRVAEALPAGWQYPAHCVPRIQVQGLDIHPPGFVETPWVLKATIEVGGEAAGSVSVYYTQHYPDAGEGPFLREERRLIDTIAGRIGQAILHRDLAAAHTAMREPAGAGREEWRLLVDVLRRTDRNLYHRVTRKMLNRLSRMGNEAARELMLRLSGGVVGDAEPSADENRPLRRQSEPDLDALAAETFVIASQEFGDAELLASLQVWMQEDRIHFLILALENPDTPVHEIASSLERFRHTGVHVSELSPALQMGLKISLVRRLLTEHLETINAARRVVELDDFYDLVARTIQLPRSHGRLGGKASGLFLAQQVLRRAAAGGGPLQSIRVPKTWHLPSDGLLQFIAHNDLDDVFNWKYQDLDLIRHEYPNLLQLFKNSRFPTEFVQGLASALDDFGENPLIVRSSSLLEDRAGSAFSGKYKSLFLANQGTKAERLNALLDAIAEVYASVFAPDPIQYRAERELLDHHEEMAIMVQEVVGRPVGRYYLPAWAGVAFTHNELRWSPRIRREDGLLRLVPGLGTRAVDRLADDYPVLAAPGQPGLRVNVSPEDIARYAPRKVDVIDLTTNAFETVDADRLLHEVGEDYPDLRRLVSVLESDRVRPIGPFGADRGRERLIFTFDGLIGDHTFIDRMRALLAVLADAIGGPVDLEFACDGTDLYLLQCRRQSHSLDSAPAPIPRDLPPQLVLFTANRYVSNGIVPDITHVVYVDPDAYGRLSEAGEMREVGRAIGRLNKILPKRQFVLMGPGRWGSRGDIRLGVSVGYADINNTAVLVEVARRRGQYVPDLSFGTHFFQDLVESGIRYLPLYPDDPDVRFNEPFFRGASNMLPRLLPEFAALADAIRVIDVPGETDGRVLRILMNADLDEAVGALTMPGPVEITSPPPPALAARAGEEHSRWRLRMAERIAGTLDPARFGVEAMYVFGSTKNATAGPGSDLDLLVHFTGAPGQRTDLELWLEGWSRALAEINYLRTGYRCEGLLDAHLVTDDDIANHSSYAAKIGAITDAARPLRLASPNA